MGKINILSENVFNTIAAGEVIERPASVVKELIENSIDAHASAIKINIERFGTKSISILDNGVGMDREDVLLCFEAHATSKIKEREDIFKVNTMGFRGEALPSIASVSKVRLRSKTSDCQTGHEVLIYGGKFISESPVGLAVGTEITISDLFYNVPARKKFLKGQATEEKHIIDTVTSIAIANANVAFELKIDGRIIISSPGDTKVKPRLSLLLGKELVSNSRYIEANKNNTAIYAYISTPNYVKSSRREQRFFVNKRAVRSGTLYSAVKEAYSGIIMGHACPAVSLFIDISPLEIDINVHPSKQEIKFKNERAIYELVFNTIRSSLQEVLRPVTSPYIGQVSPSNVLSMAEINYRLKSETDEIPLLLEKNDSTEEIAEEHIQNNSFKSKSDPSVTIKYDMENISGGKTSLLGCGRIDIVGVIDNCYLVGLSNIGLVLIDQHAAHERIIFERLLRDFRDSGLSQELLIPVPIDLSKSESAFISKHLTDFKELGFGIESFGDSSILITYIPNSLKMENISGLISDMLNFLFEHNELGKIDKEVIAKSACKMAIKANDKISLLEAQHLLIDLNLCEIPYSCPHGRPTIINISRSELEKRFGRRL